MFKFLRLFLVTILIFCSIAPFLLAATFDAAVMEGLRLERVIKGKGVYCIEVNRVSFGNKRIGFLNFSFIKVIDLEGVYFTLYDSGKITKRQHFDKATFEIHTKRLLDKDGSLISCDKEIRDAFTYLLNFSRPL